MTRIKRSVRPLVRYRKLNALGRLLSGVDADEVKEIEAYALRENHQEFISSVSHELRTPLTSLRLSMQLLSKLAGEQRMGELTPEKIKRLAETADRQIDRLDSLMDRFLEASLMKAEHLHLQRAEMDLNTVVEEVCESVRGMADLPHGPIYVNSEGSAHGPWDRERLTEALRSLLMNAALYGRGKPIEVLVRNTTSTVRVSVKDQGIGIPQAHQMRIFDLFERGVPGTHFSGLGIGLYVARQIALAHGGDLSVRSRVGEGSTFTLELPRTSRRARAARQKSPTVGTARDSMLDAVRDGFLARLRA